MYRSCLRMIVPILAASVGCSSGETAPRFLAARIQIRATNPFLMDVAGGPETLTADVVDSGGVLITSRVRIAWSSTDTTVVRVDATGMLQPRNVGFSTIHAVLDANGARVQDSIVVDVFRTTIVLQRPSSGAAPLMPATH